MNADQTNSTHSIYLISDGTCRTVEQVVRAVLVQFNAPRVQLVRHANIHSAADAVGLVKSAAADRALIVYTFVSPEVRDAMQTAAQHHMVPAVDLLGPVLGSLYDLLQSTPSATPGMLYKSNQAHFDRIDAVEYTLAHDDGCRPQELADADVVLVGVSRTSKSTTCFYLAYRGIRAANVPLFPDVQPPQPLLDLDPRRVIGCMANPSRLRSVREARLKGWGLELSEDYADRMQIARELREAADQMARYQWRSVDVSYKAIEEIAREVVQTLKDNNVNLRGGRRLEQWWA